MKGSPKLFYILSFVLVQVVLIAFLFYDEGQKKAAYLEESAARLAIECTATDDYFHDLSMVLFDEIFNQPPVPMLMRKAFYADEAGRREIRAELYRLMLPTFKRLEDSHFRQVHLHLPDGVSFLRMHKPEKFGDNILAARDTVRLALAEKKHVRGFETGKLFHAFRHVSPIFSDGELVGSIESSVSFYSFAKRMISSFSQDYKFILRDEIIEEKLFDWAKDYYTPSRISPGFSHEKADLNLLRQGEHPGHVPADLEERLEQAIRQEASPLLPLYQPFALTAKAGGNTYVVAFHPVKNLKGDPSGYIYSFTVDRTLAAFRRGSMVTYCLVTALLLLLLVLNHIASRKIVAQSRFLQVLIDAIPTPVYFKNTLRVYLGGNQPFARLFGLAPSDLAGRSDAELLPESEAKRMESLEAELLQSGGVRSLESRRQTPEGERDFMEFKNTFGDDSGRVAGLIGTIFDITDRKEAEKRIRASHAELDQVFNTAADGMRLIDMNYVITRVNRTFLVMSGLSAEDVVGRKCHEIFPGADCESAHCPLGLILAGEERVEREVLKSRVDGTPMHCLLTATPYRDADGALIGIIEDFRDITARKEAEEEIRRLAHVDVLTGLPNRALFNERLERALAQAKRYKRTFALLFLDLDGFKSVNDTYGHAMGDQVLREVGKRLPETIRVADTVSRLGGDEFTILLIQLNTPEEAVIVAERILASLAQPLSFADKTITIGASIGISVFPKDGEEAAPLLQRADNAMYLAKVSGKNTFRFYVAGAAGGS